MSASPHANGGLLSRPLDLPDFRDFAVPVDANTNARRIPAGAGELRACCEEKLAQHNRYIVEHLEDLPEIRNWHLPTP